ncbi:MAG: hypothetical protein H7320_23580 [Ferruginibacter sp.]|nr:hypothetical protein [Ferruginibacter sp.]
MAWKNACPIKFHKVKDTWNFEVGTHKDDCDDSGYVLASSFFRVLVKIHFLFNLLCCTKCTWSK